MSRFTAGQQFDWDGAVHEVLRLLPDGKLNIENVESGLLQVVQVGTLTEALFQGKLRFLGTDNEPAVGPAKSLSLSDYPDKRLAVARYRLEVIAPLLELEHPKRADVKARVAGVKKQQAETPDRSLQSAVSVASVYRWMKDYTAAGNDLRVLIPSTGKRGGKGRSRLQKAVDAMIDNTIKDILLKREKMTIDDVLVEVAARVRDENSVRSPRDALTTPTRATIARRIDDMDLFDKFAARHGKRAARIEFTQYTASTKPTMALERVEIDHTKADFLVISDHDGQVIGRPTFTWCIDGATKNILSYYQGFEPPSYLTVMECLYYAILPKPDVQALYGTAHPWIAYGRPSTLVTDNAREFIGNDLADACQSLGTVLEQTPIRQPQFKGTIERSAQTLNTMFFHKLPGTTFSNTREKGVVLNK